MPDNPSKLKNVQLPTEAGDGLGPRIMESTGSDRGAIDSGPSPSAPDDPSPPCARSKLESRHSWDTPWDTESDG